MAKIHNRLLDYLDNVGAARSQDIATYLGLALHQTQMALADLSKDKKVRRSKSGLYRLQECKEDFPNV